MSDDKAFAEEHGLVPSTVRAGRYVFECVGKPGEEFCGRRQHYARADQSGGVTVEEAEHLGWKRTDLGWNCPTCAGDDSKLREVFERGGRS